MKKTIVWLVMLLSSANAQDYQKSSDIVLFNTTRTHYKEGKNIDSIYTNGTGFVVGCKYYTVDHVVSQYNIQIESPFGIIYKTFERLKEDTFVENEKLEEIVNNKNNDVAIFSLTTNLCKKYKNDIKFSYDIQLGQEVYYIGNPNLTGKTLRHSRISRLSPPDNVSIEYKDSIGLDTYVIKGDSGSPVFNINGEVIGVIQSFYGGIGYFKPIKQFIEAVR